MSLTPKYEDWGIEQPSPVILIIGSPNSGKTVTSYTLADELHGKKPVYVAMSQRFNRPEYYQPLPAQPTAYSVNLYNDASLSYHARRFMDSASVEMSQLQAIRRHSDTSIIWDVQNSASLDLDIIRAADCVILKTPSVLQMETERPAVKKLYEMAQEDKMDWKKETAYVITHRDRFTIKIKPPKYWNPEISSDDLTKQLALQNNPNPVKRWEWRNLRV